MANYRNKAKAETAKRLLAQLINEGLVDEYLSPWSVSAQKSHLCITNKDDAARSIQVTVIDRFESRSQWRPNDFEVPVVLKNKQIKTEEDDPGSIWEFIQPWLNCDGATGKEIAGELRNSVAMLEKWMEISATRPVLSIESSFLSWEQSLITGHPTHPACTSFHRTCFAHEMLEPVGPDELPAMLNPGLTFVALPRSSVRVSGSFEQLTRPLKQLFGIPPLAPEEKEKITVPCLLQQLPAVLKLFPDAEVIKSVPSCAQAQAAIRTITVPGFQFDIKFSLACLITSAIRALPCWAAAVAPELTDILKRLFPEDLWVFGEVAAVTGSQENLAEARHLTCILRENLESRAEENNETLILASALMERPLGGDRTYAEILFDLESEEDKIQWFASYVQPLLRLALDPLQRYGIGCEFHAQNTVARICRKSKLIKGFAVRDLAGIKIHKPTLERQGGIDLSNIDPLCTDNIHTVWDRLHHALIQNNIGYMMYALGLEKTDRAWTIVRSMLSDILSDGDGKDVYHYFVKDTMPFKCFLNMRMGVSFGSSIVLREKNVPNVLSEKPRWLIQISLAASKNAANLIMPEEASPELRAVDREAITGSLVEGVRPYGQVPEVSRELNPYPAILPQKFIADLERFNEALATAYINIIPRWWKDTEAKFFNRMPLEPRVEALLRWIERSSDEGIMRPFSGNQGNLRPDILIPIGAGHKTPEFRVCEINARFPINFLHYTATANEALAGCKWPSDSLEPATKHTQLFDSLLELFNPEYPIHFVRDKAGMSQDSPLFGWLASRTGMRPRIVSSADLRLVPDSIRKTGFILCCVWGADPVVVGSIDGERTVPNLIDLNGELVEEVHQIGLQLFDYELFALPTEMVHHIALCCRNDLRSVFIAHDKRILGIILQELDALVHTHQVLSVTQAQLLREHIVPTILPGSPEFQELISQARRDPETKNGYILKPIREARGTGILLGRDISTTQWEEILASMESSSSGIDSSTEKMYVLQPLIKLRVFDWFWDEERKIRKSRVVGTYYSVNGRFAGLGIWRTGVVAEDVISASTKDTSAVLSVVLGESQGEHS
ncbi:putative protein KIAA1109 [Talaromyces islandicus]|uniref:Uncharacterized protein n=1 Tax=Talaromyces islandicus TaxID=28573 RepID=A0A0U1M8I6_TALIS|nr:putative protein KIAA1109 [Talaromyces islandicus]